MAFRFVQCNQALNVVNVKLHNSRALGLGTTGNVSGLSNSLLQQLCSGSFFSFLYAFSALKGPEKELILSFMLGEK